MNTYVLCIYDSISAAAYMKYCHKLNLLQINSVLWFTLYSGDIIYILSDRQYIDQFNNPGICQIFNNKC